MANPKRRDEKLDKLNGERTLTAGQLDKAWAKLLRDFHRFEKLQKRFKRLDRSITERLVELSKESKRANSQPAEPPITGVVWHAKSPAEPDSSGSAGTV